jgi:hypothetical protein
MQDRIGNAGRQTVVDRYSVEHGKESTWNISTGLLKIIKQRWGKWIMMAESIVCRNENAV